MIRTVIWLPKVGKPQQNHSSVAIPTFEFGHAAIEIVDGSYISKWPKRPETPYGYTMCYEEDVDLCGREADEIIEINHLNEKTMEKYWDSVRDKEFHDLFRNCCRIAGKALTQGYYWSEFSNFKLYFRRVKRRFKNLPDAFQDTFGEPFNMLITWTPYTVSGHAKYIKKIVD
ncbi:MULTISPECIES: hypothetical protein [Fischerella]|uniref:Uncharacterized protein n=3 Tax=Fischerella TaxID=1190 RepID=A0A1U7H3F6_9CYAN|nr:MULTISPECIES: hypothetical protein [Fischerella]PMB11250.1 hypothetical protein CEN49_02150 [Fischerella thermalis CCMEE 5273]BCX07049.1 MAG: hypothetical protein KatS3mg066_0908 [Fischerella sp.]MBD2432083.1 hypothetical protein [Fischerella sp. FACHB-380]OKH15687.1 hypothetical protein NIES592_06305 [Fischerella major NIES-592]PLZ06379.1 hypothetical protein CBP17_18900 [Fischerella thermalis WC114]